MQRYELQHVLGEGGMGTVYQARDRLSGAYLALKRVQRGDFDNFDNRESLAREFQTLASIRHPNIVSVLDYGFDNENHPYFTMTLLDAPQSLTEAAQSRSLLGKIDLIIQTLQALAYLHRQDILHRDLKPNNVLVMADGRVQLVDFGLAVSSSVDTGQAVGTLLYMAPELVNGRGSLAASDLFAIGVMTYEILVGEHPFIAASISKAINRILIEEADIPRLRQAIYEGLQHRYTEDTRVLIPEMPYQARHGTDTTPTHATMADNLSEVIRRLLSKDPSARAFTPYDAIDMICEALHIAPPIESAAIRRSFLSNARFVGRSEELQRLKSALQDAIAGQGSAWLIDGESGVGKSRLIEEHRVAALVRGVQVIRAEATQDEAPSFELSRQFLPQLLLRQEISSLEARTLKHLIPTIDDILGYQVQSPTGSFSQARGRVEATIIDIFKRLTIPTLLIVENLQWAEEDMFTLRELTGFVKDIPLMLVGSYRNDEAPYLYGNFYYTQQIHLERFGRDELEQLSRSMLGKAGSAPTVIDMLERESEGNITFAIDILQNLGRRFSRLDDLITGELPQEVYTHGIMDIARRRVQRLPLDYQPLMRLAAVAGRDIDFEILRRYDHVIDFSDWINEGMNASILTTSGGRWQFAHDKLREGILFGIMPEERTRLHRMVAEALMATYPDDLDQQARAIEHLRQGDELAKAIEHSLALADQLLAAKRAPELDKLCRELIEALPEGWRREKLALLRVLTKALVGRAADVERTEVLGQILALSQSLDDPESEFFALSALAWMQVRQRKLDRARQYANQSLRIAKHVNDKNLLAATFGILAHITLAENRLTQAIAEFQQVINLYREAGNNFGVGTYMRNLARLYIRLGYFEAAKRNLDSALDLLSPDYEHMQVYGFTQMILADYYILMKDFDRADAINAAVLQHFTEENDDYGLSNAHYQAALLAVRQDQWERAAQHIEQALIDHERWDTLSTRVRIFGLKAMIDAHHGDNAAMKAYLSAAYAITKKLDERPAKEAEADILKAMAYVVLRRGDANIALLTATAITKDHPDNAYLRDDAAWLRKQAIAAGAKQGSRSHNSAELLAALRHRLNI